MTVTYRNRSEAGSDYESNITYIVEMSLVHLADVVWTNGSFLHHLDGDGVEELGASLLLAAFILGAIEVLLATKTSISNSK